MFPDVYEEVQQALVPPHSGEAERAFLGSLLIDPDAINRVDIHPDEIYVERNRAIYDAIRRIVARHGSPDIVTVSDELRDMGSLELIGGSAYVIQVISEVPTSLNIQSYAEIIRDKARRRKAIRVASELVKLSLSDEPIVEGALSLTNSLTSGFEVGRDIRSFADIVSELYDEISERAKNPLDLYGLPTGFLDLDKYLGGLPGGTLFYIAGRPGIGKSKLAHQIGLQMAMPKWGSHPGAIISIEMPNKATVLRAISWITQIGTHKMKLGKLDSDEWTKLTAFIDDSNYPVYIDDSPRQSVESLWAKVASMKSKYGIEWIVVDYTLLMSAPGKDETERSTYISAGLKAIAREFDIVTMAINSVVKEEMDNGRARMGSMRGSGQALHDADLVAFLMPHQPDGGSMKNDDLASLVFTKVRDIEMGLAVIDLYAHKNYPMFSDVTYNSNLPY